MALSMMLFVQLLCVGLAGQAWSQSKATQEQILADLRADQPHVVDGSTVILEACRAVGPATIFESPWGFTGALRVAYDNATLRGGVLSEEWRVTSNQLEISIYKQRHRYPFIGKTWIYQWPSRKLVRMNSEAALEGLENAGVADCPAARAGHGSPTLGGVLDYLLSLKYR